MGEMQNGEMEETEYEKGKQVCNQKRTSKHIICISLNQLAWCKKKVTVLYNPIKII